MTVIIDYLENLLCQRMRISVVRNSMKILERLLSLFDVRRRTLIGAVGQPPDLTSYLYTIRADAYQRLTGKALTPIRLPSNRTEDVKDLKDNISPSQRLLGRNL